MAQKMMTTTQVHFSAILIHLSFSQRKLTRKAVSRSRASSETGYFSLLALCELLSPYQLNFVLEEGRKTRETRVLGCMLFEGRIL